MVRWLELASRVVAWLFATLLLIAMVKACVYLPTVAPYQYGDPNESEQTDE